MAQNDPAYIARPEDINTPPVGAVTIFKNINDGLYYAMQHDRSLELLGGSGGLSSVTHDETLQGAGTILSPLGLNYKSYVAKIDQNMTNAPVPSFEKNELGAAAAWSYLAPGFYLLTIAGAFADATKVIFPGNGLAGSVNVTQPAGTYETPFVYGQVISANAIAFVSFYNGQVPADSILQNWSLELRVYP